MTGVARPAWRLACDVQGKPDFVHVISPQTRPLSDRHVGGLEQAVFHEPGEVAVLQRLDHGQRRDKSSFVVELDQQRRAFAQSSGQEV
jgi:hypothetical protein